MSAPVPFFLFVCKPPSARAPPPPPVVPVPSPTDAPNRTNERLSQSLPFSFLLVPSLLPGTSLVDPVAVGPLVGWLVGWLATLSPHYYPQRGDKVVNCYKNITLLSKKKKNNIILNHHLKGER